MAKAKKDKKKSIADKIVDLTAFEEPLIVELYGRSGTGKTTLLSTFPKPILLLDIKDHGAESARSASIKKGDIDVLSIENFDELEEAYEYITDNLGKYKTVAIDTMTGLQELAYVKVMEDESKNQMSQRLYGLASSMLKQWIMHYKELSSEGIIPVFICQDRTDNGDGEGEDQLIPEVGPALMPAVSKLLNAACKVIGHTYIQENSEKGADGKRVSKIEYRLRLGPNPYYITKIRKPKEAACPSYLTNPTYEDILAISKGEYKEAAPAEKTKKKKKSKN